jgi:DNA (cytosine-5)-methyltransferase 1
MAGGSRSLADMLTPKAGRDTMEVQAQVEGTRKGIVRTLTYGSVCSGIEAATVAWEPLGWQSAWFAEIDPFASAVLAHRYPGVPNRGDFTRIESTDPIDLLVGGTPCQSFSVADKRLGVGDPRGNLTLEFLRLAARVRPRWLVWENVPGVLSIDSGRTFGTVVWTLAELGYGVAYRVLDAQFFGVPQRRRPVFVIGHLGGWQAAAAVLFERESLRRDTPARGTARKETAVDSVCGAEVGPSGGRFTDLAPTLDARCKDSAIRNQIGLLVFGGNNTAGSIDVATACNAHGGSGRMDFDPETFVVHTLRGQGFDASEDGTGHSTLIIPLAFPAKDYGTDLGATSPTLRAMPHDRSHANAASQVAVYVQEGQTGVREYDIAGTVRSNAPGTQPGGSLIRERMAVRRLTPRECERLQGFPDDWTLVPNYLRKLPVDEIDDIAAYLGIPLPEARIMGTTPDGPRYRAIGNSMAVPVMRWIGERIQRIDAVLQRNT